MEGYQKVINAPSLMSSLRNTDPHCLWKDDAWLDADSALQTAAQSQDIIHGSEPQSHRTEGGKRRGVSSSSFKSLIMMEAPVKKAAVASQKWENWPPTPFEDGYKCKRVRFKKTVMIKSNTALRKREHLWNFDFPPPFQWREMK